MGSRLTECPCGCTYVTALYKSCPGDYHDKMVQVALRTLAANLAVGGALCKAFSLGHLRGMFRPTINDSREIIDEYERAVWRPGCGRAWGGGV